MKTKFKPYGKMYRVCLHFYHNGTPESKAAFSDLSGRISDFKCYQYGCNEFVYDFYHSIESGIFNQCNGLFEYVDYCPGFYSGVITDCNYYQPNELVIVEYDVLEPNVAFWYMLLYRLYGNLITLTYIASEKDVYSKSYTPYSTNIIHCRDYKYIPIEEYVRKTINTYLEFYDWDDLGHIYKKIYKTAIRNLKEEGYGC